MRPPLFRAGAAFAALAGLCAVLAGCAVPRKGAPGAPATLGLRPVSFANLPGWRDDDPSRALPAFLAACAQMPQRPTLGGSGEAARLGASPASWQNACRAASSVPAGDAPAARRYFETYFSPYALSNATTGSAAGLFTGYYEPEVAGSRVPTAEFRTPLLSRPLDLMQVDLGAFSPT